MLIYLLHFILDYKVKSTAKPKLDLRLVNDHTYVLDWCIVLAKLLTSPTVLFSIFICFFRHYFETQNCRPI